MRINATFAVLLTDHTWFEDTIIVELQKQEEGWEDLITNAVEHEASESPSYDSRTDVSAFCVLHWEYLDNPTEPE